MRSSPNQRKTTPLKKWWERLKLQLADVFRSHVTKQTLVDKDKHPDLFRIVSVGLLFLIVIGIALSIDWSGKGKVASVSPIIEPRCKEFNFEEWQEGPGLLVEREGKWAVASTSDKGMLRYGEAISLDSRMEITFVPQSENQVNFVIHVHDLYEVVIGDGSYQGVTLKASIGNDQGMEVIENTDGERRNTFEGGDLKPGKDITVILDQEISRLDTGSYEVDLRILHRPSVVGIDEKLFATYDFQLPPKFNYEDITTRMSMGLLAATDGSEVSAEILCFEVI